MVNVENCQFLKGSKFISVIWVKWKQSVSSITLPYSSQAFINYNFACTRFHACKTISSAWLYMWVIVHLKDQTCTFPIITWYDCRNCTKLVFRVATFRGSQKKRVFFSLVRESQGMPGNSVKSQGTIPKSQGNFLNSSNYWYTVRIQGSHFA